MRQDNWKSSLLGRKPFVVIHKGHILEQAWEPLAFKRMYGDEFFRRHCRCQPLEVAWTGVSFVGFSWGAMVGLIVASDNYAQALGGERFRSIASFYPGCFRISRPNAPTFDIVSADMRQPVLVLMGDSDLETPATECIEKLQAAKSVGSAVDWHVYPGTGHCWDCKQLDGFSKVDIRGNHIQYYYRSDVTQDSSERLFRFLE